MIKKDTPPFILIEIYHVLEETAAFACRVRGI